MLVLLSPWISLLPLTPRTPLGNELGCSPTLSLLSDAARYRQEGPFVYFDPLQLGTDDNFARFREAELKHGRCSMLAMAQIIVVPIVKHLGGLSPEFPEGLLARGPLDYVDYTRVIGTCGLLELFVLVQRDPRDMPGDYGVGFFGVRDKAAHETQLIMELEHGRLAMMGMVGFVAFEYLTGGMQWLDLLEAWAKQL